VIPTAVPAIVVQATLGMAGAIIGEAALSFLGLGVQPPTPSWGTMLNGGRVHILDAPHLTIFPGVAIAVLVLGFNFLGDGLRDRLDPRRQA
jgi:ABC-type dipeptide/oligopeptide/nickel transport system permease subunit